MKDLTLPTPALLPCPFCGGEARVYPRTCDKETPYNPADRAFPIVRCGKCGAEAIGDDWKSEATAIEKWNTRAALSSNHEDGRAATDKESLTVGDFNLSVTDAEGREWRLMPVEATREMCLADWPSKVTLSDAHTDWGVSEVVWREMGKLAPRFEGALGGEKGEAVAHRYKDTRGHWRYTGQRGDTIPPSCSGIGGGMAQIWIKAG